MRCGGGGRKRCSACKRVVYCSRDCQRMDWERHKQECNKEQMKWRAGRGKEESLKDWKQGEGDMDFDVLEDNDSPFLRSSLRVANVPGSSSSPSPSPPGSPLTSGIRILADGTHQMFVAGRMCDRDGFPLPLESKLSRPEVRVVPCVGCGGQGRVSTTCDGIVRTEYCSKCEGEGAIVMSYGAMETNRSVA